ncbi:MAG TPA: GtrA family protein [Candidatus Saccharimonadales bacterium]|nr:GtrA family protein [Candidatus Saccharimonadales bacterium]
MAFRYLHALLSRPFGRYLIIGVSVYLFEIAVLLLAKQSGMSSVVAVSISFWLGTAVSFLLQKVVAFRDKRTHHRILLPQALAVGALIAFNYGFTVALTWLLDDWLPLTAIRTIALGITILWNFALYKTVIFKQKDTTAS